MNRSQIEKQMRTGLLVVGRMEATKNNPCRVMVEDDPVTGDLLFSCGADVRRITTAEMLDAAADNETLRQIANLVREHVKRLSDNHNVSIPDSAIITIRLTAKQAEKLAEILDFTNDEGPQHEGWASAELESIREIVRMSLKTMAYSGVKKS